MKLTKKFMSAALALTMALSLVTPAMATTDMVTYPENQDVHAKTTSEYDMICELQACTEDELSARGYSAEEILDIQQFDYEQALYNRAQMSVKELKDLGYSDEQIEFLKNYDGGILNEEEINLMSAEMSETYCSIWPDSASSSKITCHYYWEWDSKPLLYGTAIKDKVVVAWVGADASGNRITTNYINSETQAVSNYYKDGKLFQQKKQSVYSPDMTESVFTTITGDYAGGWAKSGYFIVAVEPTSSSKKFDFVCFTTAYSYNCGSNNDFFEIGTITIPIKPITISLRIKYGTEKNHMSLIVYKDGSYKRG